MLHWTQNSVVCLFRDIQSHRVAASHRLSSNITSLFLCLCVLVVIAVVILVLFLLLAVILRYMYKHKGTYHTNEAKGTEFAETADAALRGDPALQDAMDESKKEYFIWHTIAGPLYTSFNKLLQAHMMPQSCLLEQWSNWLSSPQTETNKKSIVKFLYISISEILSVYIYCFLKKGNMPHSL